MLKASERIFTRSASALFQQQSFGTHEMIIQYSSDWNDCRAILRAFPRKTIAMRERKGNTAATTTRAVVIKAGVFAGVVVVLEDMAVGGCRGLATRALEKFEDPWINEENDSSTNKRDYTKGNAI